MNLAEQLIVATKKQRKLIVVIGDTMTDVWIHGKTAECQDGCKKFVRSEIVTTPGGAANAFRCLSMWGIRTELYGFNEGNRPVKTRYVEDGRITFRYDDDGLPERAERYVWARKLGMEMVSCADAVLLSDYDKGFLTPEFIRDVAGLCKDREIPCVADCKREPKTYPHCILKGNESWYDTCRKNNSYNGPTKGLVVSFGSKVPLAVSNDTGGDSSDWYELPEVHCQNHVGAGDCFAAHLTLALAYGYSLKDAAAIAHSAGRVYVQHAHNRPPLPSEIVADMATASIYARCTPSCPA